MSVMNLIKFEFTVIWKYMSYMNYVRELKFHSWIPNLHLWDDVSFHLRMQCVFWTRLQWCCKVFYVNIKIIVHIRKKKKKIIPRSRVNRYLKNLVSEISQCDFLSTCWIVLNFFDFFFRRRYKWYLVPHPILQVWKEAQCTSALFPSRCHTHCLFEHPNFEHFPSCDSSSMNGAFSAKNG